MRESRWFALGLVLGGLILAVSTRHAAPAVHAQASAPGQRWEYQCFEEWGDHGANVDKRANELGKQGWEMAAAASPAGASSPHKPTWCFKRPLQ